MTSNKPRALATKAPTSATKASASASHPYAGATTRSRAAQTRNNQGAPTIHNVIGATANKPQQELFQLEVLLTHKPGETLTIACRDNDSMKVVLENIRTQLGIQPDDVVVDNLYINGNNLRVFGGTVGYYRIFGRVFTYHPVLKQKRAIHVRLDNGEVLVLEPPSLDGTLGTLAKMISDMEGIPVQEQKFTLMGLPLVTYEQTLKGHVLSVCQEPMKEIWCLLVLQAHSSLEALTSNPAVPAHPRSPSSTTKVARSLTLSATPITSALSVDDTT
ncbi:hypothetical protein EC991_005259 [Linnemannia zychae]|nr:hypothetical protein EC991_005259 [Linnemannia zychae]